MAPFQYQDYDNRLAGSIADIMARRGDIVAASDRRIGQIMGGAEATSGAVWGRALDVGAQAFGQAPMQAQQLQAQDVNRQSAALDLQQKQNAIKYMQTATTIAQHLTGPNGDQTPSPDAVRQALTASGIPVQFHDVIVKPFQDMQNNAKEARADAAALAYRTIKALPDTATDDDRNHAVAGALGAAMANEIVSPKSARAVMSALASGSMDPQALTLGMMSTSPSGRYKDVIQDETKLQPLGGRTGGLYDPKTGKIIGQGTQPPTAASLAATAADKTKSDAERAAAKNALDLLNKPKTPKSLQRASVLLDGKSADVLLDPDPEAKQKVFDLNGQPVDNAAARVKPIPPASVIVQQMGTQAIQQLPDWARDGSRPAPTARDSNLVDPNVRMTPNGLYQAAINFIDIGQLPQAGRGNDPASQVRRTAIESKVGAIASDAGLDVPTLRAIYQANKGSLANIQKQSDAVTAFMTTADRNVALFEQSLTKMPDAGAGILNRPWRAFQRDVMANPDLASARTYMESVRNEYARIITQANLNNQLTDNARQESQKLIRDDATVGEILASARALKAEGSNRLLSLGDQIRTITQRTQSATMPGQGQSSSQAPPPLAPASALTPGLQRLGARPGGGP